MPGRRRLDRLRDLAGLHPQVFQPLAFGQDEAAVPVEGEQDERLNEGLVKQLTGERENPGAGGGQELCSHPDHVEALADPYE